MKNKFVSMLATALAVVTVFSSPAFAASSDYADASKAEGGQNITQEADAILAQEVADDYTTNAKSDEELVALAANDVLQGKVKTYKTAPEVSRLVQLGYQLHLGYTTKSTGSISVTKAKLDNGGWFSKPQDVYVVALSGTDFFAVARGQSTGVITDLLSGFEFDNPYVRNVKKVILKNIPVNSNLFITGHSLGGMVSQQVSAEKEIKAKYNIVNVLAFGSPLLDATKREGTVTRLGDVHDIVPYLSVNTLNFRIIQQIFGLNREDGGYRAYEILSAHCKSYQRSDVWGKYDVTGKKNGKATLTFDFSTTNFFYTPFVSIGK